MRKRKRKRVKPDIAITHNSDESKSILEGLKLIKAEEIVTKEDVVVIVPNWVNDKKLNVSDAVIVGTNSLKTIIKYVKNLDPKRIVVAAGSGGCKTIDVMKKVGYHQIIQDEKVDFIDLNKGPYKNITLEHNKPTQININEVINEATILMSFTQLKHHEEATMSAAIKNIALSLPPAEIHGYPKKNLGIHDDLHGFIRAMAQKIPIDISIVSANPAMVGTGPSKGTSKHTGIVICGTDALSVDVVCARLLGFKPQGVNYLFQCSNTGVGESDINKINILGLTIQKAEELFSKAVYGDIVQVDADTNNK